MSTDELKIELEEICDANGLTIDFNFNYPVQIIVRNNMQVNFFDGEPVESYLRFRFIIDQIDFDFFGDFKVDDKLFSKLLNKVKKLHYIYLQEWYKEREDRLQRCIKPLWSIKNGDYVAIVRKHYKG